MRLWKAVLGGLVAIAACGQGMGSDVATSMAPSVVGDTIVVDNPQRDADAPHWKLVEEQVWTGAIPPDREGFGAIYDFVALPDGHLAVLDIKPATLTLFDAKGKFVKQMARTGNGPGEVSSPFNGIAMTEYPDGTVAVWQFPMRVNLYRPDGSFRTNITDGRCCREPGGQMGLAPDARGRLKIWVVIGPHGRHSMVDEDVGTVTMDTAKRMLVDSARAPATTLEKPPMDDNMTYFSYNMVPVEIYTLSQSGQFVWAAGDRYAIRVRRDDGKYLMIRRPNADVVPLVAQQKSDWDGFVASEINRFGPNTKWYQNPVPEVNPFLSNLEVDHDGRIWAVVPIAATKVEGTKASDPAPKKWKRHSAVDLFESSGRYMGRVDLPRGVSSRTFAQARGDLVWLIRTDPETDVQSIVRYRMVKTTK